MRLLLKFWYKAVLYVLRTIGFGKSADSRGVIIFKTDRIGDFILGSGVLHLLVEALKPCKPTLMVSELLLSLTKREFPHCSILAVPPSGDSLRGGFISGWFKVRRRVGDRRYAQLISIRHHPTLFEDLLLTSIATEDSVAVARTKLGEAFWVRSLRSFRATRTFDYPQEQEQQQCRELEAHRRLAEAVLNRTLKLTEVLPLIKSIQCESGNYLLVLPEGSDPIRTYPRSNLQNALVLAGLPTQVRVVVCSERSGSKENSILRDSLRDEIDNEVDLVFPDSLIEFVNYIAAAGIVISMESAGAHIATVFDKPGVFILGGGHFGNFAPWRRSEKQRWLHLQLSCFGCDWLCNQGHVRCIKDIPPEAVAKALREVSGYMDKGVISIEHASHLLQ